MNAPASALGGKVLKQSLPVLQPPVPLSAPALKRLQLAQGELAQFYDDADGIRYIAFIELREGGVRGNHYHKVKEEFVYVIDGEALLLAQEPGTRERVELPLQAGDLAWIQTGIAHAMRTRKPGRAIEFSKARFDPRDIYPHQLTNEEGKMMKDE